MDTPNDIVWDDAPAPTPVAPVTAPAVPNDIVWGNPSPAAPVSSVPNDIEWGAPQAPTAVNIPQPLFDQRRVQDVQDTDPEHQAYLDPNQIQQQNAAYADMYAAGQSKNLDSSAAAAAIKAKYPILQSADPKTIQWYIDHYRQGGKTFPDFTVAGDKGLTVTGKQAPVTTAQAIAQPVADFYTGVGEGFDTLHDSAGKAIIRGIAALKGGDAPEKAEADIKDLEDSYADQNYTNPTGWGRFSGNLVGSGVTFAPAVEAAPFAEMGAGGQIVDTALQGAGIGAASSGGKDVAANTALGALTGTALHTGLGGLTTGVGLVKANIPEGLASHFNGDGSFAGLKRAVFGTDNPKVTAQTFEPEFVSPEAPYSANRAEHLANIKAAVDDVTGGWDNSPDFNIIGSTRNLTNAQRAEIRQGGARTGDVQAWVGADGKVNVIAGNIDNPSQIPAILYHEVSGHIGLNKQFGDGLDDLLQRVYDTNWRARQYANDYVENNPNVYKDDPSGPHVRATEEYLASQQEQGPQTLNNWEKVKQYVRDFGRNQLGMDLRYNDTDVKTILQQAHTAATGDSGRVSLNGGRFMYAGKSSAGDTVPIKPTADNTHVDRLSDDDYTGTYHPVNIRDPKTGEVVSAGRAYVDPETGAYQGSTLMHPLTKEVHTVDPETSSLIESKLPSANKELGTPETFTRYDGKPGEIPVTTYTTDEAERLINQRLNPDDSPRFSLRRNGTESLSRMGQDIASAVRDEQKTVQTWEESKRLAENMGLTPSKLFKTKVFDAKPETALAISKVVDDLVGKSSSLEERVARGTNTEKDLENQTRVLYQAVQALQILEGHKTDLGRSTNILNAIKDIPYDQLKDIDIGRLSDPEYVKAVTFKLNEYRNKPQARAAILRGIGEKLPEDVITGMHYDLMLSGLDTQSRNIFGQTTNLLADMLVSKPIGKVFGETNNALKAITGVGEKSETMSMREYGARWGGIMRSLSDLGTWKQTAQSFQEMHPLAKTDQQYATQTKNPIPYADYGRRTLSAVDNLMHSLMMNSDYYGAAVRDGLNKGLKGPKLADHVDMLVHNPTPDMVKNANSYASDLSLIGKSDGPMAQAIQAITRAPLPEQFVRRGVRFAVMNAIPWMRVPANAVRTMLESNLLTTWFSRNTQAAFSQGGSSIARQTALAKAAVGTALGAYFMDQYDKGNLRRNPVTFGLEYKSGGQWNSMRGMDPLVAVIAPAMAMHDALKGAKDKDPAQAFAGILNGFSGAVMTEGFGTQLSDLMDAMTPGNPNAQKRLLLNQTKTLVPALGRDIVHATDPVVHDVSSTSTVPGPNGKPRETSNWTREMLNNMEANVPGLSTRLPAKLDVNGQPIARHENITGLFDQTPVDTDPVNAELDRLEKVNGKPVIGRAKVLSTEGQAEAGKQAHDAVSQMIQSPVWDKIPDSKKIQLISKQYSHARSTYRKIDKANQPQTQSQTVPDDIVWSN